MNHIFMIIFISLLIIGWSKKDKPCNHSNCKKNFKCLAVPKACSKKCTESNDCVQNINCENKTKTSAIKHSSTHVLRSAFKAKISHEGFKVKNVYNELQVKNIADRWWAGGQKFASYARFSASSCPFLLLPAHQ